MGNPKPETGIVDDIVQFIKDEGGDAYKTLGSAAQRGGEPDVTGEIYIPEMEEWLHLKLEVKTSTGAATARQKFRVELYKKRGYCAGIVRSVEEVQKLIGEYVTEWRVKNYERAEWKAKLETMAEDNVRQVFGPEIVEQRDEYLAIANGFEQQVAVLTQELQTQAHEIAGLRLWIDRFTRPVSISAFNDLVAEVKRALDWL